MLLSHDSPWGLLTKRKRKITTKITRMIMRYGSNRVNNYYVVLWDGRNAHIEQLLEENILIAKFKSSHNTVKNNILLCIVPVEMIGL